MCVAKILKYRGLYNYMQNNGRARANEDTGCRNVLNDTRAHFSGEFREYQIYKMRIWSGYMKVWTSQLIISEIRTYLLEKLYIYLF